MPTPGSRRRIVTRAASSNPASLSLKPKAICVTRLMRFSELDSSWRAASSAAVLVAETGSPDTAAPWAKPIERDTPVSLTPATL